jgi:hypothetical protein
MNIKPFRDQCQYIQKADHIQKPSTLWPLLSKDPDNIREIATGMVSFLLFVCVIKLFQIVHYI